VAQASLFIEWPLVPGEFDYAPSLLVRRPANLHDDAAKVHDDSVHRHGKAAERT
jgi:hypothetical protein